MKTTLLAVCSALALSACADDYYGYNGYYGGYDGGRYSPYYASGGIYYDGYYGPYYGGYWGRDGYYYYRSREGAPYARDQSRHFRRDYARGYRHYGDGYAYRSWDGYRH